MSKKITPRKIIIAIVILFVLVAVIDMIINPPEESEDNPDTVNQTDSSDTVADVTEESKYKLQFGELLSAIEYPEEKQIIIKAKIESQITKKTTIDQNYYNIDDLVKNYDLSNYEELQYWAVADMSDGSESKVISFTVSGDVLTRLKDGKILPNRLSEYVDELWIHPSLTSN